MGKAVARSGTNTEPASFGQPRFDPPLDLRRTEELRLWIYTNRAVRVCTFQQFVVRFGGMISASLVPTVRRDFSRAAAGKRTRGAW
jgi:hypothetical protein